MTAVVVEGLLIALVAALAVAAGMAFWRWRRLASRFQSGSIRLEVVPLPARDSRDPSTSGPATK